MVGEPSRSTNGQTSLILHLAGAVLAAMLMLSAGTVRSDFEDGAAAYHRGDYEAAFEEWQRVAEKGDVRALYNLGVALEQGIGGPVNLEQARRYFQHAARLGHAKAQFNLGLMYEYGRGVPQDFGLAAEYFQAAADQGLAKAQLNLAALYFHGNGVFQDYETAAKWLRLSADAGLAAAQFNYFLVLLNGQGVEQDEALAFTYLKKASKQGHPAARGELGKAYYRGRVVQQDYVKACTYITDAVNAIPQTTPDGNDRERLAKLQNILGVIYLEGNGVDQDLAKARFYLEESSRLGNAEGSVNAGQSYFAIPPADRDYAKAAYYYSLAIDRGLVKQAANNLAIITFDGLGGVPKDYQRVIELWRLAAEHGESPAAYNLGQLYQHGVGELMPDCELAEKYYRMAIGIGHQQAKSALEAMLTSS